VTHLFTSRWTPALAAAVGLCLATTATGAPAGLIAGNNLGVAPSGPITVPWDSTNLNWVLNMDLVFDPSAGPMTKLFQSPMGPTGGPIQLDATQPFPQPVWENFFLDPDRSLPVSDWHEHVLTPGWEWVIDPSGVLITINGDPIPWKHQPMPDGTVTPPHMLWVEFDPIPPGNILDVHKQLLWVGTPGNRIWGDGVDDAGNSVDERFIEVLEYPTPEPGSLAIFGLGVLALARRRRG